MKPIKLAAIICLISATCSFGQAPQRPVMRDAATSDQLANQLRSSPNPMHQFKPSEGADPSKTNIPQDIIGRSDILCFNGMATLVPKQAIIFIPSQYADRVGIKPGAQIVTWADFFAANRGWITAQEITISQAEGKEPLPEKTTERISKGGNLVVATCQGGPISKLAPKPAADIAEPKKVTP